MTSNGHVPRTDGGLQQALWTRPIEHVETARVIHGRAITDLFFRASGALAIVPVRTPLSLQSAQAASGRPVVRAGLQLQFDPRRRWSPDYVTIPRGDGPADRRTLNEVLVDRRIVAVERTDVSTEGYEGVVLVLDSDDSFLVLPVPIGVAQRGAAQTPHVVLTTLWARQRGSDVMMPGTGLADG